MSDDIVDVLGSFLRAYPEDIFPTPPEHLQAKDAAVAHVMRRVALPWMERARDEIVRLRSDIERAHLARIEAQNPGIDMKEVRRVRGAR